MPPSELELDRLAELLAPAGILVRPIAVGMMLAAPPPSDAQAGWRAWFASLCDDEIAALLARLPANPELMATAATLGPRTAIGDEAPHILLKGMPIVDRIEVWTKLPALMNGAQRILQISGATKVGKSYHLRRSARRPIRRSKTCGANCRRWRCPIRSWTCCLGGSCRCSAPRRK
jgi:hypothetical protein